MPAMAKSLTEQGHSRENGNPEKNHESRFTSDKRRISPLDAKIFREKE